MQIHIDGPKVNRVVFIIDGVCNIDSKFSNSSRKILGIVETIRNINKNIYSEINNEES